MSADLHNLRACRIVAALCAGTMAACVPAKQPATAGTGDSERGRLLLEQYDCGSCHVIPGVRRAQGRHGPALDSWALRAYIAGELPNQPELLVQWIKDPAMLVPGTAMPDLAVADAHARDMGAYLMTLH